MRRSVTSISVVAAQIQDGGRRWAVDESRPHRGSACPFWGVGQPQHQLMRHCCCVLLGISLLTAMYEGIACPSGDIAAELHQIAR